MSKGIIKLKMAMFFLLCFFLLASTAHSDSAYDNSSFDGAWMMVGLESIDEYDFYFVSDGAGQLVDAGFFSFVDDEQSAYNVSSDGSMTLSIHNKFDGVFEFPCQLTSESTGTCIIEEEDLPNIEVDLIRIEDVSAMQGSWIGSFSDKTIIFAVSDNGDVGCVAGLHCPTSGKMFAHNDKMIGFLRTAADEDESPLTEIILNGSIEGENVQGSLQGEWGEESEFNFSLTRDNTLERKIADLLFDGLEALASDLFSPSPQPTLVDGNLYYRLYSDTGTGLGVIDNELYYLDPEPELHNVGDIHNWLNYFFVEH